MGMTGFLYIHELSLRTMATFIHHKGASETSHERTAGRTERRNRSVEEVYEDSEHRRAQRSGLAAGSFEAPITIGFL